MTNFRSRLAATALLPLLVLPVPGIASGTEKPRTADPAFPLKVSKDGRHLVDRAGNPFLVVGDSPWSLIVQLEERDIQRYLDDRRSKGFNAIIVNLIEHKFSTSPPKTRAGLAPFKTPGDFSTPDKAYFDFAHKVIEMAGERGIAVWLAPAYLGYGGGDEGFFKEIMAGGIEKLRAYGRFVGNRFRDLPNIVWMMGGDYTPEKSDQWVVTELAAAIREVDTSHLMTAHHKPGSSAVAAFGEQSWLVVNTVYSYEKNLFEPLLAEYRRTPVRPFVLLESTYEGEHDSTPDQIRRQAYWAMLSGACGQFFGNNPIWHFDGPGLFPARMTWQQALDAPGSRDMSLLRAMFDELPWFELLPDDNHVVPSDAYDYDADAILTACTTKRDLCVAYLPSTGVRDRAQKVVASWFAGPVRARWYNPTNGQRIALDGSPFANESTRTLLTPGNNGSDTNDWVLILDAR